MNDVENFITGDFVEHVAKVKGDEAAGWATAGGLGLGDKAVHLELDGFYDEVHPVGNSDGVVIRKKMSGESDTEGLSNVASQNATESCGYADGPKFGGVIGVFVEAEQVGTCEVRNDERVDIAIVESGEESNDVGVDVGVVQFGEGDEHVHAVHLEAIGLSSRGLTDGFNDVAWELKVRGGRMRGGGGGANRCFRWTEGRRDGSWVELADCVLEGGLVDDGNGSVGSGSRIRGAIVVHIRGCLGCLVDRFGGGRFGWS